MHTEPPGERVYYGKRGIMCARKRTPDGWLVKEDGSWDEEAGR